MIIATLGDFEVEWQGGKLSVRPDLLAEIEADERGVIGRTGLAAECLKLRVEIERRMTLPAYDSEAFEADDRPFRVPPGSSDHARLVLEALGAEIELELDDDEDPEIIELERLARR